MDVIFMPNHQIWKMLQCAHILSLIMHFYTGNVYCGAVLTVLVSIFLTKKQLKNMKKQHPQLGFTFTLLQIQTICTTLRCSLKTSGWKHFRGETKRNNKLDSHLHLPSLLLGFTGNKTFTSPSCCSLLGACWLLLVTSVLLACFFLPNEKLSELYSL